MRKKSNDDREVLDLQDEHASGKQELQNLLHWWRWSLTIYETKSSLKTRCLVPYMIWGVHSETGDFVNHDYPKLTVMSALGQKSFRHICIDLSNSNIHIKYKKSTSIDIFPLSSLKKPPNIVLFLKKAQVEVDL